MKEQKKEWPNYFWRLLNKCSLCLPPHPEVRGFHILVLDIELFH